MAFKTWTVGEVVTASDMNTMLQKQVLIVCTSGTRPSSPAEGFHIYETDTNKELIYNGAAWITVAALDWDTSFTSVWSATGTAPALGNGTIVTRFKQLGSTVEFFIRLVWGSTTTGGTLNWQFTLPVAPVNDEQAAVVMMNDNSAAIVYEGAARVVTGSPHITRMGSGGANITATTPFTWATNDILTVQGIYQVAS